MLTATIPELREDQLEDLVQTVLTRPDGPSRLELPLGLDRDGFLAFCARNPDLRTELEADGTVTIMSPIVSLSTEHEDEAYDQLKAWWRRNGRVGKVYGSSAGFTLPSGAVKSPDASWVSPERLADVPAEEHDHFMRVVPDFVIEVRSKSDSLAKLKRKMRDTWLDAGVRLAWLLDPRKKRAYVYRPSTEVEEVSDFTGQLDASDVVPGFVFELGEFE